MSIGMCVRYSYYKCTKCGNTMKKHNRSGREY